MLRRGISETSTGLAAEYIAAAAIIEAGWKVGLAQQDRVDLVAWRGDNFLRVQVKSSNLNARMNYQFQLGSGSKKKKIPTVEDYDVLALVALAERRVLFLPIENVKQLTKRVSRKRFENPLSEMASWDETIEVINGRLG